MVKRKTMQKTTSVFLLHQSGRQDSNLRPQAPKARALPTELLPVFYFVETAGFEPASSDFQSAALTIFATFPFVEITGLEPVTTCV